MSITRHLRSVSGRFGDLARWHVSSQEGARRNAMVASTELTRRRIERDEVEEFLLRHHRVYVARAAHAPRRRPA